MLCKFQNRPYTFSPSAVFQRQINNVNVKVDIK